MTTRQVKTAEKVCFGLNSNWLTPSPSLSREEGGTEKGRTSASLRNDSTSIDLMRTSNEEIKMELTETDNIDQVSILPSAENGGKQ
jgi:hypothetical protein